MKSFLVLGMFLGIFLGICTLSFGQTPNDKNTIKPTCCDFSHTRIEESPAYAGGDVGAESPTETVIIPPSQTAGLLSLEVLTKVFIEKQTVLMENENELLEKQNYLLDKQNELLEKQNELLEKSLPKPPKHHSRPVSVVYKALSVVDHAGSVASIASIFGVVY